MASMTYRERATLLRRDACNQAPPEETETFLIGNRMIAEYEENHSSYGCDVTRMYPAWKEGKRAFLLDRGCNPAQGYSAEGTEEVLISFEDGLRIILEKGLYGALVPDAE